MTAEPLQSPAPTTRRERQRIQTHAEIVATSRRLLRTQDAISLSAVAHEMGMTPPALYRYVDGYDELLGLVADAVFDDIVAAMRAASARHPADDPGAQLVSAAVAFRQWALAHREEFALIFANRHTADQGKPGDKHGPGGQAFTDFFSSVYVRVYDRYRFALPTADDLPEGVYAGLEQCRDTGMLPCEFPGLPIGINWVFMRAWARLYGMVTLEVFGHLDPMTIESGAMFAEMMNDNGRDLNLGDDWERLTGLIRDDLDNPPAG